MLLTVKSIRIKRMNVEIFCERGVRKGVGHYFWGVCRGKRRSQGRWGVGRSLGARGVRRGKRRSQGRGAMFLGSSQGARTACMIVFPSRREIFCKFEFYVHIHYYF